MVRPIDLLRQDRTDELWQLCCGFIDLSMDQFMAIQKRLLLEQIDLLNSSHLGRKVMRGALPQTIDEFRRLVPLTTYADYCPDLQDRREDALPSRPARWIRTSGYSGTYDTKWVPWTEAFSTECERVSSSCALFAMSRFRGDISHLSEHWKVLYTVGGPEYASGTFGGLLQQAFNFDFLDIDIESDGTYEVEKLSVDGLPDTMDNGTPIHWFDNFSIKKNGEYINQSFKVKIAGISGLRSAKKDLVIWDGSTNNGKPWVFRGDIIDDTFELTDGDPAVGSSPP